MGIKAAQQLKTTHLAKASEFICTRLNSVCLVKIFPKQGYINAQFFINVCIERCNSVVNDLI